MAHDLLSLITVLQQDRIHEKALIESLLEKVTSLKNLLEKSVTMQHHLKGGDKEILQELQSEIRDAAHKAEDIIESRAVTQMLFGRKPAMSTTMRKVMEKFDAPNDKLANLIIKLQTSYDEEEKTTDVISNPSLSAAADQETDTAQTMVGFEEDAVHLKGRLISDRLKREIIPIVGMGGIGKTTLARNLYNDKAIASNFDVCAWVTVSQDYSVRAILLGLLDIPSADIPDAMLADMLYQRLIGRRYLVVLDDIWSQKAWDAIQRFLPNTQNRSRIMITSREIHVAKYPDSACEVHEMRLMSDAQGWDLLRWKVFGKVETCPLFLEEIGRKIASDCGGLPLAISVIGGLLYNDKYSKDLWIQVARDVRSIIGDRTSEILCLSYDNLPVHLKPCFLYISAFPEDYAVSRSRLMNLFLAEGFLWRSNAEKSKSLEDVAEEYLKALVDRNLISITRKIYDTKGDFYSMHDLLRDLCVRKAKEEKFLSVFKYGNINSFRRLSVHQFTEDESDLSENLSCCRSLLFIGYYIRRINISSVLSSLRLVRVLDVRDIPFDDFPMEILKLANLRFLCICFSGILPPAIWKLRNLQTLQLWLQTFQDVILPKEAWEISGLRHISLLGATISIDFEIRCEHKNLQIISGVSLRYFLASNLVSSTPNIKELDIVDSNDFVPEDRIIDLSHLQKLETLKLDSFRAPVFSTIKLPNSLKELSFFKCTLPMGLLNGVSNLQYIQVLKINRCEFQSEELNNVEEWELTEGVEFFSLEHLELDHLHIKRWKADDYSPFPKLSHLRIHVCDELEEMPTACIAEISTLELIEVDKNNPSHVDWANEVRETQRDEYGYETLEIRLFEY